MVERPLRAVLGIDAAWTVTNPSGVALACETPNGWRLMEAASSYDEFCQLTSANYAPRQGILGVLAVAQALCGRRVDLVAVDMPLSRLPITQRRFSDNAVSTQYGGRGAGTHTPSAIRPGPVSDRMRADLEQAGYPLRTSGEVTGGLIEVYPHPALIEFAVADRRLPYKFGKRGKYWPDASRHDRSLNVWQVMRDIGGLMENEICGVDHALRSFNPDRATGREWKAHEDKLDAIVCAAVAICVLEGRAIPYGDDNSAIWVPRPGAARQVQGSIIAVRSPV